MFEHVVTGLAKTGWVLIPLLATSLFGWFLVFHRGIALGRMDWSKSQSWRKALEKGNWESWLETMPSRDLKTVTGGTLAAIYRVRFEGRYAMEARLDEAMKFHIPELERFLSTLAILASAAPLMGLLGTVAGMVRTFQVISAFGTGNQAMMSDSISESLLATQNGLLVAFPLMIMHVFLSSKAEAIEKNTLSAAQTLVNQCSQENDVFSTHRALI